MSVMEMGTTTLESLRGMLARDRRRAWVRVLFGVDSESATRLRSAQIIVGQKPEGWESRRWIYPEWTFVSAEMTARAVSELLAGDDQKLIVEGVSGTTQIQEHGQWFRHASRQFYGGIELPWPSRTVTFSTADGQSNAPGGYLVGSEGPSFPSFGGAYSAFFFNQWTQTGASQATLGQITFRLVDGSARIRRIVVRAASVDVWVDGRTVRGSRLELNSSKDRIEVTVERSGRISVPLCSGLGDDAWLWLKDETDWIDYRPIYRWGGQQNTGVEFEDPDDPMASITSLATHGETTYLEYKRALPEDNPTSQRKSLKTIVAFANGDGGTMLFGVDGDDNAGEIVGLLGKPAVLMRRLNDLIRDRISPPPKFTITGREIEGRFLIQLEVSPGEGALYALALDLNKPEYFVRRNGSTYYARPEELVNIVGRSQSSLGEFGSILR
jgi:Putative DNA-binding domain